MKFIFGAPSASGLNERSSATAAGAASDWRRRMPYFTALSGTIDRGEPVIEAAFGRHVHWGFWPDPSRATVDAAEFAAAAEQLTREICDAGRIADDIAVLDVGCGFGGTIASINERFRNVQLAGINIDGRQLARAREKATASNGNRIALVAGDATCLPFADASFDRVLAVEAIFHFPDRVHFFREARRVLKPGGVLALSDFIPVAWIWPQLWLNIVAGFYGACDMRYSLSRYRRLARDTGLYPVVERNVNSHTLPTFAFLKSVRPLLKEYSRHSNFETSLLHVMCRLGLLRYSILAFEKT